MTERMTAAQLKELSSMPSGKSKRVDREGPIQKAILAYIAVRLPSALVHHSPNETNMRGRQAQRMVSDAKELGMRPGWPDIEILWQRHFWTMEVKAPGGYPTENQIETGRLIVEQGGKWAVVRSVEDAKDAIHGWKYEEPDHGWRPWGLK